MLAIAVAVPAASLMVLGSFWLWQNSFLIHWALAASAFTLAVYAAEAFILRDLLRSDNERFEASNAGSPAWDESERAAWQDVQAFARTVKSADLDTRDKLLALGLRTIERVAHFQHPSDKAPLLKFTVPEALAVIAGVSGRLGPWIADHIPLGDRLTVKQMFAIYRWRSVAGVAVQAYDLWRIIRLLNPTAALANEVRERVAGQLLEHGREELANRLTRAYVEAVGRAAIDLYSGRLMGVHMSDTEPVESGVEWESASTRSAPAQTAKPLPATRRSRLWSQMKNAARLLRK